MCSLGAPSLAFCNASWEVGRVQAFPLELPKPPKYPKTMAHIPDILYAIRKYIYRYTHYLLHILFWHGVPLFWVLWRSTWVPESKDPKKPKELCQIFLALGLPEAAQPELSTMLSAFETEAGRLLSFNIL